MNKVRKWKYWVPVFYTIVWIIGFLIGIFGVLPAAEGPLKMVVAAFTSYFIFLVNAFIDFRVFLYNHCQYDTKPTINISVAVIAFLCFTSIILSRYYVITENVSLFVGASFFMVTSFFGMECLKYNPRLCFHEIQGSSFTSNL